MGGQQETKALQLEALCVNLTKSIKKKCKPEQANLTFVERCASLMSNFYTVLKDFFLVSGHPTFL